MTTEPLSAEEREQLAAEARQQTVRGPGGRRASADARRGHRARHQVPGRAPPAAHGGGGRRGAARGRAVRPAAALHRQRRLQHAQQRQPSASASRPTAPSPPTPTRLGRAHYSTGGVGLAWNLLDFGVSYFRARQLSDQKLIAEERRRKAVQTLVHDVRIAWWRAEAAQRLLPDADRLLAEIDQAIEKTRAHRGRQAAAAGADRDAAPRAARPRRSRSRCAARSWRRPGSSSPR